MTRPKESQRKDIKALTLKAAKDLFLKQGYSQITMRKIAEKAGCTPGAIYLYFQNKGEILYELHNEGFKLLFQYKQNMLKQKPKNAWERLKMGGKVYIAFGLDNPEFYELMFNMPEPRDFLAARKARDSRDQETTRDYAMLSYDFLRQGVLACQEEGYLNNVDTDVAAFAFWSTVHGMVSLMLRKRIPYPQEPTMQLADKAMDFLMDTQSGLNNLSRT